MSEKLAEVFEQYDVEIIATQKGRGATILTTPDGVWILEAFRGNLIRLEQEYVLKQLLKEHGFDRYDAIIPNRDGCLFTCDRYRQPFVMKRYFVGTECDMKNPEDIRRSVKLLAQLHTCGQQLVPEFETAWEAYQKEKEARRIEEIRQALERGEELERICRIYDIRENMLSEILEGGIQDACKKNVHTAQMETVRSIGSVFARHNRELQKIYKYVTKVKKKNSFETLFLQVFQTYYKQGGYCTSQLTEKGENALWQVEKEHFGICHGSFNQHNVLLRGEDGMIVHFERFSKGNQLNDLYQFARKVMEKNHFDFSLLEMLLDAYSRERTLSKEDYRYIYILFSYPEKFWKIANGYYNMNKAFLSPKHVEKLQNVILQEEEKKEMLSAYGRFLV